MLYLVDFLLLVLLNLQGRFILIVGGRVMCPKGNGGESTCVQTLFSIFLPTPSGCLMFAPDLLVWYLLWYS